MVLFPNLIFQQNVRGIIYKEASLDQVGMAKFVESGVRHLLLRDWLVRYSRSKSGGFTDRITWYGSNAPQTMLLYKQCFSQIMLPRSFDHFLTFKVIYLSNILPGGRKGLLTLCFS
jgi:hypothetical protein